ncbi:MAG: hypothetical protein QOC64_396 [Solirubrobacteraceae bacterium]|nr:hypothetical protein [Solirubrobacteraceae bacterium]
MAGDALEGPSPPPARPRSRGEELGEELLRARLDAIAAPAARSGRFAGLVAGAVVGTTAATVGYARRHPAGSPGATIFEIGSVTKLFTALALADMAEEGLVGLDDPVGAALPPGVAAPSRRGREVTLAQLATHTSGLPRLPKGLMAQALRHRDDPYARFTVEDLHAAVATVRLRRAPGRRFRYSNFGAGLLGHVLARRAGLPYEELVAERILRPLGMGDTTVTVAAADRPRLAPGHSRRGRPVAPWHLPTLAGAGALRSTADDLLRFLGASLDPPPSRLGRAIARTHEPRARAAPNVRVGLGWMITRLGPGDDRTMAWHNGGTGGYRSFIALVPQARAGVVVLASSARSVDRLGTDLMRALAG